MISDNTKGNKYHDESGKFTSGSNASEKSGKKQYVPKKSGSNDFATEWLKSLVDQVEKEDPTKELLNKLQKMNEGDTEFDEEEEPSKEPEKHEKENDKLFQQLEKGDFVNIDAGLLPYEYGYESYGYEDLAVDAHKTEDGKYEVYMYLETEDGPVSGEDEPAYVFDSYEELEEFISNGYTTSPSKETEEKLGEMGFGESDDVEHDEDYERSWGPKDDEEGGNK